MSASAIVSEARERLEWIRDEYGDDDIDFQTFGPVVELVEGLLERTAVMPDPDEDD